MTALPQDVSWTPTMGDHYSGSDTTLVVCDSWEYLVTASSG